MAAPGNPRGIRLRLLTYNVHRQTDDLDALARVVRSLGPDVVCIQEGPWKCFWRRRGADLARRLGLLFGAGGQPAVGNLILVNHRVRVHETWWTRFPLKIGRHLRGVAFARCSVAGVPFVVAGSHLSIDETERPDQARRLAAALAGVTEPLLFGGDVNEPPGGPVYQELVTDRLVDAARGEETVTFSIANPRYRIDWLLIDRRCTILDYRVVDTPDVRLASDHFPVLVDVELPPAG